MANKRPLTQLILDLVGRTAQLAATCTEPAAIALAAAEAAHATAETPREIVVSLSPGILKNSLAVGLPLTDHTGPDWAAALGAIGGDPRLRLQVLKAVTEADVAAAADLIGRGSVTVRCHDDETGVFVEATAVTDNHTATARIVGDHGRIVHLELDGRCLCSCAEPVQEEHDPLDELRAYSYREVFAACLAIDPAEVRYLLEGTRSALELAERKSGGALESLVVDEQLDRPLGDVIRTQVAAAVGARMAGIAWPVLTSGGSGNQGITTGIPILLVARSLGSADEEVCRALLIAHATNLYSKAFLGRVAPYCGAVSAGAGVAAAVCYLSGGDQQQVERAAEMILGSLFGLICDGAKQSCIIKCTAAADEGVRAGNLARHNVHLRPDQGVIGRSLDATLATLAHLADCYQGIDRILLQRAGFLPPAHELEDAPVQ